VPWFLIVVCTKLCTKFSTVAKDQVWMLLRVLSAVVSAAAPWGRRTFVEPEQRCGRAQPNAAKTAWQSYGLSHTIRCAIALLNPGFISL